MNKKLERLLPKVAPARKPLPPSTPLVERFPEEIISTVVEEAAEEKPYTEPLPHPNVNLY